LGWLLAGLLAALFVGLLTQLPTVADGHAAVWSMPWAPALGLSLSFYLDGLSLLFSLIITGVGAIIVLYAAHYFDETAALFRFYGLTFSFMAAMLGLVLAGNVITLFIAWELTSVVSFLLIGFYSERAPAREGALQALIVTAGGGLALFVGLVLVGTAAGSMEMADILSSTSLREHPWYAAFTILIAVGCFAKSAQAPFHFWLPGAMAAPTPASAYLHSATMVKAGIYLLLRFAPVLGDTSLWQTMLVVVGGLTMLIGALSALRQHDLKAILAYATVSQLGAFVALIGLPHGEGVKAALAGILAHSLYKAALFLVAGAVDHATGTRDVRLLGGLARRMPGWAAVAALAGLSMAGVPPLLGFLAKESLIEALGTYPAALVVIVLSAACTVATALVLTVEVFGGRTRQSGQTRHLHRVQLGMLAGPAALAGVSLAAGLLPNALVTPLLVPFLGADLHLALFSGWSGPLALSLAALTGGVLIFQTRATWREWRGPSLTLPTAADVYQGLIDRLDRLGDATLRTQGGKLRLYLLVILGSVTVLQATAVSGHLNIGTLHLEFNGGIDILRGLLLLLAVGAMAASIAFRKHLMAALCLGLSGYAVGGIFLIEPAPDVALVQFMVETLGTVLLIVMLTHIDKERREEAMAALWRHPRAALVRDALLAAVIGAGMGLFALVALNSRPKPETIATWHIENALSMIGVHDVVGAIVTDFRGLDTIMEITVFSIAALGTLTLLSTLDHRTRTPAPAAKPALPAPRKAVWRSPARPPQTAPAQRSIDLSGDRPPFISGFSTPLTRIVAQLVLPFAFLIALVQLLYGGDAPGDGFTAGVISGLGIALWYIVFGYSEARQRLRWLHPRRLIGGGLALVLANAAFPLLVGLPFLAHIPFGDIALFDNLHLSSTLVYETGIFLTVLGCVSMIMEAIANPREAEAQ
jgi:NADH:ubiquinone oxidoreductase subunit 5 (subunit L)/multisubunit Na+/H+ antiporter MnhA subunit